MYIYTYLRVHGIEEIGRSVPALGKLAPVVTGVEDLRAQAEPVLSPSKPHQNTHTYRTPHTGRHGTTRGTMDGHTGFAYYM